MYSTRCYFASHRPLRGSSLLPCREEVRCHPQTQQRRPHRTCRAHIATIAFGLNVDAVSSSNARFDLSDIRQRNHCALRAALNFGVYRKPQSKHMRSRGLCSPTPPGPDHASIRLRFRYWRLRPNLDGWPLRVKPGMRPSCSYSRSLHESTSHGSNLRHFQTSSRVGSHPPSLYEELFPEQAAHWAGAQDRDVDTPALDLGSPRLRSPRPLSVPFNRPKSPETRFGQLINTHDDARDLQQVQEKLMLLQPQQVSDHVASVMLLRASSANLNLDDFMRIQPSPSDGPLTSNQGRPAFIGAKEGLLTAFPMRDQWTLKRHHSYDYVLIFSSRASAEMYRRHVHNLHGLMAATAPTSVASPMTTGALRIIPSGKVRETLQTYTLMPTSTQLILVHIERDRPSNSNSYFEKLVRRGGYPQIVGGNRDPEIDGAAQVILWFPNGAQPELKDIVNAINVDGQQRGLRWAVKDDFHSKGSPRDIARYIRRVALRKPLLRQTQLIAAGLMDEPGTSAAIGETSGVKSANGGKLYHDAGNNKRNSDVHYTKHSSSARKPLRRLDVWEVASDDELESQAGGREDNDQRWIIRFKSSKEGKRFVRAWHMRPFPWVKGKKSASVDSAPTTSRCELLW